MVQKNQKLVNVVCECPLAVQCSVQSWAPFSEGSLISRIYNDLDKTSSIANEKILFAMINLADTNVLNIC